MEDILVKLQKRARC